MQADKIKRGINIGIKSSNLYAKIACDSCDKIRWVRIVNGQPRNKLCRCCGVQIAGKKNLGKKSTIETKQKMRDSHLGLIRSEEHKRHISEAKKGWNGLLGKHQTAEHKANSLKARIAYYASGGWRNIKPTKLELRMDDLLQELLPKEYKFVGNGYTWIVGKCPDFLNVNGQKKLIEVFGNYVHKGETGGNRISHFKKYGFDTLIVWEDEFQDINSLSKRILNFNKTVPDEIIIG